MKEMIDPLTNSLNSLVSQQTDWDQQRSNVKELQEETTKMNQKVRRLSERNDQLETRVKHLEQKLLENNIIVHGVKESKWELDSTHHKLVTQMLSSTVMAPTEEEKLQIVRNIPVSSTSQIGCYNSMKTRPIRITFACKSDADLLLERKKKLHDGVFVDREYSEEDEKDRKLLCPIFRAARKIAHYRGKCKLDGVKLVIKGKSYDRSSLKKLPEDLNSYNISSRESEEAFGFFGELNPLSNFHLAPFVYNNIKYHCTEQLIQHQKAKLFDDKATAEKIMNADDALGCKHLSKEISNYNHETWKREA